MEIFKFCSISVSLYKKQKIYYTYCITLPLQCVYFRMLIFLFIQFHCSISKLYTFRAKWIYRAVINSFHFVNGMIRPQLICHFVSNNKRSVATSIAQKHQIQDSIHWSMHHFGRMIQPRPFSPFTARHRAALRPSLASLIIIAPLSSAQALI